MIVVVCYLAYITNELLSCLWIDVCLTLLWFFAKFLYHWQHVIFYLYTDLLFFLVDYFFYLAFIILSNRVTSLCNIFNRFALKCFLMMEFYRLVFIWAFIHISRITSFCSVLHRFFFGVFKFWHRLMWDVSPCFPCCIDRIEIVSFCHY